MQRRRVQVPSRIVAELPLSEERLYRTCLDLATKSKAAGVRFGAVIVKNGRVIGRGWNHKKWAGDGPELMGYAIHAEVAAMNDALRKGHTLKGAQIYVAGYFAKDGHLYVPREDHFSCNRCPSHFLKHGIAGVNVPRREGWAFMSSADAFTVGREYARQRRLGATSREEIGATDIAIGDVLGLAA